MIAASPAQGAIDPALWKAAEFMAGRLVSLSFSLSPSPPLRLSLYKSGDTVQYESAWWVGSGWKRKS